VAGIEDDIIKWAKKVPVWQRNLLKRIARGEVIDDTYIEDVAKAIVAKTVTEETPSLSRADLPSGALAGATTRLVSIGKLENINALLGDQNLTFGLDGVTVIYGDNASGKSGYARLVKDIVGARHREELLPDAYAASTGPQSASIVYESRGSQIEGNWAELEDPALQLAHFYDEACGNDYLERESELSYRPSVLAVFDQLIKYIDLVKAAIEDLVRASQLAKYVAPSLTANTTVQKFLLNLSGATPLTEVDALLTLGESAQQTLAELIQEEARLKTTEPSKEKTRLNHGASRVEALADHFATIARLLSASAATAIITQQVDAKTLRTAANEASKTSFAEEPLANVGSESWRALWESAERYSMEGAYPDQEFPVVEDGSLCVLCQQRLGDDARGRLTRFHQFIHNDVEKRAKEAEKVFAVSRDAMTKFAVSTTEVSAAIEFINKENKELGTSLQSALTTAQSAKERLEQRLSGETEDNLIELAGVEVEALRSIATATKDKSKKIDETEFKNSLATTTTAMNELKDKLAVADQGDEIKKEIDRLKSEKALRDHAAGISTSSATKFSADLARKYVTDVVKDQFVRESERLKLEHVVLGDKGSIKGKLRHQPALLGATGSSPRQVLSEGEQTAAGLAGFFTEIHFDASKSAVVFDDPMSSLDHERRDKAARRVVEIATDRQVIVFTHDLVFLGEMVKVAGELKVTVSERTIERNGAKRPGLIVDNHPWKAKDAKARLASLETGLADLKKKKAEMSSEDFEKASSDWAGRVSETWERIVRSEIVFTAVDRGTTEVRPKKFRVFVKVTEQDDTDFQIGYGNVSKWARRHDKSEETNYIAPTVTEMEEELKRIREFWDRVKRYDA
jgi:energy-coupling factor transporter ATP-binding protein EcfA2